MPSPYGKYGTCIMDPKWGITFDISFMLIQLQILQHLIAYWYYFSPHISIMSFTGLWWISIAVTLPLEYRLSWYCNSRYTLKTARSKLCSFCHPPLLPCSLSLPKISLLRGAPVHPGNKVACWALSLHAHPIVPPFLQGSQMLISASVLKATYFGSYNHPFDSALTVSDHIPCSSFKLTPVNDW